jgi:hypothetical protein
VKNPSGSSPHDSVDGEDGVRPGPGDDDGVVGGDQQAHPDLPPAEQLGLAVQPAEGERRGAAVAVTEGVLEDQQRDPADSSAMRYGRRNAPPPLS